MILAIVFNVALAVHNAVTPVTIPDHKCVRFAKYVAQAYDAANTARLMPLRHVPEIGEPTKLFGRYDPFVVFISDAVLDLATDVFTKHSHAWRCNADSYELNGAVNGILFTNGMR